MAIGTTARSPLDGLISCGRCGAPMDYKAPSRGNEAQYDCNQDQGRRHHPLSTPANITDHLIIGSILDAIFTDKAISTVRSTIIELDQEENTPPTFPVEDLTLLKEDPHVLLNALRTPDNARNFLAKFITRINFYPDKVVIQYAMPLPSHSHLHGATEQEVLLSDNLTS